MDISRIENATRTIGESQGYLGLPLRDETINCSVNGEGTPCMVTEWVPDDTDLSALNQGGAIHLRVIGTAHPPVMMNVAWPESAITSYDKVELGGTPKSEASLFGRLLCWLFGHKSGDSVWEVNTDHAGVDVEECPRCVKLYETCRGWKIP